MDTRQVSIAGWRVTRMACIGCRASGTSGTWGNRLQAGPTKKDSLTKLTEEKWYGKDQWRVRG